MNILMDFDATTQIFLVFEGNVKGARHQVVGAFDLTRSTECAQLIGFDAVLIVHLAFPSRPSVRHFTHLPGTLRAERKRAEARSLALWAGR